MKVKVDYEDLELLLIFLQDKIEDCYKRETKDVIDEYLREIKESNK